MRADRLEREQYGLEALNVSEVACLPEGEDADVCKIDHADVDLRAAGEPGEAVRVDGGDACDGVEAAEGACPAHVCGAVVVIVD